MKSTKKKTKPHLSPSSITQYLKCSAQFMFRKLIGNKPPSIALLYGKSVDEAINVDMEQKILTRKNLPMDDIKDAFVFAMKDLEKAISISIKNQKEDQYYELIRNI